jgi:gliding motility-associated-like protein
LSAGTYTYKVKDSNGCEASVSKTITAAPSQISATVSITDISCYGYANGKITVSASGGNGIYQYSKDNGLTWQGSSSFASLSAGTYSIQVKDINGCSMASQSVTIREPDQVVVTGVSVSAKCNGGNDGSIDLTVSGGSGYYTYLWSNGAKTQDISGLSAGTYTVIVSELSGCSVNGDLSFTVRSLDNKPVAKNDLYTLSEDVALNGNVSTNDDLSCDGGNVWSLVSYPLHGVVVFNNNNGSFNYVPDANYSGADSFSYKLCDNDNDCSTASVTITVSAVNDPPIAGNDVNLTLKNVPVSGNVLLNDSDPEGNRLTIITTPVSQPANGKVIINPDGTYTYTPNPGYSGSDSFVYQVCDNGNPVMCNQAEVTIKIIELNTISNRPVAINDNYQGSINLPVKGSVLSNDFDPDGNLNLNSVIMVGSAPSRGTLTLNSNGTFTYVPETGFLGQVSFIYQVCDSGSPVQCDEATVTIEILANPNGNSTFATDDSFFVKENTSFSGNILTNDNDPQGDIQTVNTVPLVPPAHGTLVLNANGTISYNPVQNYIGIDQFVYEICDNGIPQACDKGTVYMIIAPVNYTPVAVDDKNQTNEDLSINGDVSTNDISSRDGGNIWTLVSQPKDGKVVMSIAGSYTYTPNDGFNGTDTFTYKLCDANGDCDEATVSVTVLPVNDVPVAEDDQFNLNLDGVLNESVAENDIPGGDGNYVWTVVTQPANGTLLLNLDGSFTYTPKTSFSGSDSFSYRLCDKDGDCDQATVTITLVDVILANQIFTPNGDGQNDTFHIEGIELYPDNRLSVFNRWGNEVYEKSGYNNDWDGVSNKKSVGNASLPVGTYYYVLEYGNNKHKTGFVYLER